MTAIILLLALSALVGFALETSFSWFAIAASSVGIAVLSSTILQIQGFSPLPGIVFACLTIKQRAYLAGAFRPNGLFEKRGDKEPSQGRDDEIARKNKQKQAKTKVPIAARLSGGRWAARGFDPRERVQHVRCLCP